MYNSEIDPNNNNRDVSQRLQYCAQYHERETLPLILEADSSGQKLTDWYKQNKLSIESALLKYGVILFRGFNPGNTTMFEEVTSLYSSEGLDYTGGITPRRGVTDRVFHSTDLPPEYSIPLHNELAYSHCWPMKLMFYCDKKPGERGETPIADCRRIFNSLPDDIRQTLLQRQFKHVHNYHNGGGPGLSWQESFYTNDKKAVEAFCRKNYIDFYWLEDGALRTEKVVPAISRHPETDEVVWFNNLLVHHPYNLGIETYSEIVDNFGENYFPTMIYYGDGSKIEFETFSRIRNAVAELTVALPWQEGDIMLIDNMLAMHGRNPFKGPRKILLSMSCPMKRSQLKELNVDASNDNFLSIYKCIYEKAQSQPDALALDDGNQRLSYAEVIKKSESLAEELIQRGAGRDKKITVCLDRSCDFVIAILAILRSGSVFVPVEPSIAEKRLQYIVEESESIILICQMNSLTNCENITTQIFDINNIIDANGASTVSPVRSTDNAYIIYTSGSTGKPKGVTIQHNALVSESFSLIEILGVQEDDVMLHSAAVSFVLSVRQVLVPLLKGCSLIVANNHQLHEPLELMSLIKKKNVTLVDFIPSYWLNLNSLIKDLSETKRLELIDNNIRQIVSVGEAFIPLCIRQWRYEFNHQADIINVYGQTETAGPALYYKITEKDSDSIPVGSPLPNCNVMILDESLKKVADGQEGEIAICGKNLARGYLCDNQLTDKKFKTNSYDMTSRIYMTGDQGVVKNGYIYHLGRKDKLVKIQGNRIDLNEIEAQIYNMEGIVDTAVTVEGNDAVERKLVAFISTKNQHFSSENIKSALRSTLPSYMIPAKVIFLDSLPRTDNGKIDRQALYQELTPQKQIPIVTEDPQEEILHNIWESILKIDITPETDFFQAGGNSLQATQTVSRIRKKMSVELTLRELMQKSVFKDLLQHIEASQTNGTSSQLELIPHLQRTTSPGLSFPQKRLWFLEQLAGQSPTYNIVRAFRISGYIDYKKLENIINMIVCRHDALRTSFKQTDEGPVQYINDDIRIKLDIIDTDLNTDIDELIQIEVKKTFDVTQSPLLNFSVIQTSAQENYFVINIHHIISDRWSIGIFIRELNELYRDENALKPLDIQYADYSDWQTARMSGDYLRLHLDYWKKQLADTSPIIDLPLDFPRRSGQCSDGGSVKTSINEDLSSEVQTLARENNSTLFMVIQTAFSMLLSKYSGQEDILIGTPIANRNHEQAESLIGFFVNTLVLRNDLSNQPSFRELLQRNRKMILEAYEHQDLPFERIIEELQPERNLSYSPLFQVMIDMKNTESEILDIPDLDIEERQTFTGTAKFEISLSIFEENNQLSFIIEYKKALFKEETIKMLLNHFCILLKNVVESPDKKMNTLSMLSDKELMFWQKQKEKCQKKFNTKKLLHEIFEAKAEEKADNIALTMASESLTYRQANEEANRLSHYLISRHIGPGKYVAICTERSIDMVIAILAVLKSGAAYLPVDPEYPENRIHYMINDLDCALLICSPATEKLFSSNTEDRVVLNRKIPQFINFTTDNPQVQVREDNDAYVIYTSGTTGKPKGIAVQHKAILNHMLWMADTFELSSRDRFLQKTPFSFDASVWEFYIATLNASCLVIAEPQGHKDSDYIIDTIQKEKISVLQVVPTLLSLLISSGRLHQCNSLKYIFSGGEVLQNDLKDKLFKVLPDIELYNFYGPSEATIDSTFYRCRPDIKTSSLPLGKPITNAYVYILDESLQQLPTGVTGEIYIGGKGLSRGYINNLELTKEKFIDDPINLGEKLYKTGDLGLMLADGNIVFKGRRDHQIKLRGFRIELEEITEAIKKISGIRECCTILYKESEINHFITSYVIFDSDEISSKEIKEKLKKQLPDYMIPSHIVCLESIPLTQNGKIDRKALPTPDKNIAIDANNYCAPVNASQQIIISIWQDILGLKKIGIHDDFFQLGGHSLLATQVISRIKQAYDINLPLRAVFEKPTVSQLNNEIDRIRYEKTQYVRIPPIKKQRRTVDIPLSYSQQRMWFLYKLEGGSSTYNIPSIHNLCGPLEVALLQESLNYLIARHEILRTCFSEKDGKPIQCIQPELSLEIDLKDLSRSPKEKQNSERQKIITEEFLHVFNLSQGPLLKLTLLRIDEQNHTLLINIHHSISDGWSMVIFCNELSQCYNSLADNHSYEISELPLQYADFSIWQQHAVSESVFDHQMTYWKKQLEGAPQLLKLPTDKPRPFRQNYRGKAIPFSIPQSDTTSLKKLCSSSGSTTFMMFQSIFALLLSRYSRQNDIVIGFPIANRNHCEIENLIGCFVNTLPIRTKIEESENFLELISKVRSATLDAYDNQDLPLDRLVEELHPDRTSSYSPLFQVLFVLHNNDFESLNLNNISSTSDKLANTNSKFDIILSIFEKNDEVTGKIIYNTDLFNKDRIEAMAQHFCQLLHIIGLHPQEKLANISMLTEDEKEKIINEWNNTASDYPGKTNVVNLFEAVCLQSPESSALITDDESISYEQLNNQANKLSNHLIHNGFKPKDTAVIFTERSPSSVIALIAILKAGGVYVSMDLKAPKDRLNTMIKDCSPAIVLTQEKLIDLLPETEIQILCLDTCSEVINREKNQRTPIEILPDELAYICYTSGSTGVPKGVCVSHKSIIRLVRGTNYTQVFNTDRLLQYAPISFDASTFEIWASLLNGASLVIMPPEFASLAEIGSTIQKHKISILWMTTGLFNMMVEENIEDLKGVRQILTGGETISPSHAHRAVKQLSGSRIVNCYGPTENTTFTTFYTLPQHGKANGIIPIGKPISNTTTYILDPHCNPLPPGVAGELYAGGAGVAAGYLNHPELTEEKFINNPFTPGDRLYKTGDLARYLSDGNIEYLGRIDSQVKIRGYRIEIGEIEKSLDESPLVKASCVQLIESLNQEKSLVSYITVNKSQENIVELIKSELKEKLPEYMIPTSFILLKNFPLNRNGKVDRSLLPMPEEEHIVEKKDGQLTPLQVDLLEIWQTVLGKKISSIQDDFFAEGGHSLMMTRLISIINKKVCPQLPLKSLFQAPSVAQMALLIEKIRLENKNQQSETTTPLFWIGGGIQYYEIFKKYQEPNQELILLESYWQKKRHQDFENLTMEILAKEYIDELKQHQNKGPYLIGGYSIGGLIAYECARQLTEQGDQVDMLFLLDPSLPLGVLNESDVSEDELAQIDRTLGSKITNNWKDFNRKDLKSKILFILRKSRRITSLSLQRMGYKSLFALNLPLTNYLLHTYALDVQYPNLIRNYEIQRYTGKLTAYHGLVHRSQSSKIWRKISVDVDYKILPTDKHKDVLKDPIAQEWAECLKNLLATKKNINKQ